MSEGLNFIHPLAHIGSATIGSGNKIWQFASVIRDAHLGDGCTVASSCTIDGAWIGDRCIVSHGVLLSPGCLIGNDVFIGPNVSICNDRWPSTSKDDFDIEILFADFVSVHIKDGASIGANSAILPGITIGKRAMVAAGMVARTNVPDNHILMRDGNLLKIRPEWRKRRMREAC